MPAAKEAHVVTVSDRCASGLRADASGPAARAALEASGWAVTS
ncbi:MAG: molybdenum cofactor biosynthesis protein MoaB, partial [Propioniciclava sp.]|nr:molybdenum cofactor biosynthesis protein MoaB [Propioniciclava sp.]